MDADNKQEHQEHEHDPLLDDRIVLSPKETARITGWSRSFIYLLIQRGELDARKDGKATKITTRSIRERIENLPRVKVGIGAKFGRAKVSA
jgi:excisionase family DNA binding protein